MLRARRRPSARPTRAGRSATGTCPPGTRDQRVRRDQRVAQPVRPGLRAGPSGVVRFSTRTRSRSAPYGPGSRSARTGSPRSARAPATGSATRRCSVVAPRCPPGRRGPANTRVGAQQPGAPTAAAPGARRGVHRASTAGPSSSPAPAGTSDRRRCRCRNRARTLTRASSRALEQALGLAGGRLARVDRAVGRAASAPRTGTGPGSSAPTARYGYSR